MLGAVDKKILSEIWSVKSKPPSLTDQNNYYFTEIFIRGLTDQPPPPLSKLSFKYIFSVDDYILMLFFIFSGLFPKCFAFPVLFISSL